MGFKAYKDIDDDSEQKEMALRIRNTKIFNDILAESKKAVLEKINDNEKNVPYDERPSSWDELLEGVIGRTILKHEEIPIEEKNSWVKKIKEGFSKTEKEFLLENGRTIREGHEPTIDSGMEYMKIR